MPTPSQETIEALKKRFPERALHQVETVICGDEHILLMTSPSQVEYQKYTDEMLKALELKGETEKVQALRGAQLRAILAQTRWPDRDEVQRIFEYAPEAVDEFHKTLREHAGAGAEVRSKKL
jgi:hypothetical protein